MCKGRSVRAESWFHSRAGGGDMGPASADRTVAYQSYRYTKPNLCVLDSFATVHRVYFRGFGRKNNNHNSVCPGALRMPWKDFCKPFRTCHKGFSASSPLFSSMGRFLQFSRRLRFGDAIPKYLTVPHLIKLEHFFGLLQLRLVKGREC